MQNSPNSHLSDDERDEKYRSLSIEDFHHAVASRTCPLDGDALADRDNPRIPGLNRELYCSCGFAITT